MSSIGSFGGGISVAGSNTWTQPQTFTGQPSPTTIGAVIQVGLAPFDGVSVGKFSGSAAGTLIGANVPAGYLGNALDIQVAGSTSYSFNINASAKVNVRHGANTWIDNGTSLTLALQTGLAVVAGGNNIACQTRAGSSSQTADLQQFQTSGSVILTRVDASGRLGTPQVAAWNLPTVAAGAQGSAASLGAGSTDTAGVVNVTCTAVAGIIAVVTFNVSNAYHGLPFIALGREDAVLSDVFISSKGATSFTLSTRGTPAAGSLVIDYIIIGG